MTVFSVNQMEDGRWLLSIGGHAVVTGFASPDDAHTWLLAHMQNNYETNIRMDQEDQMRREVAERELKLLASTVLEVGGKKPN